MSFLWALEEMSRNYYRQMDVFVFPSLYEGLPVTMIEEQAAGVPAVSRIECRKNVLLQKDLVKVEGLEETPEQWAGEILKQVKD